MAGVDRYSEEVAKATYGRETRVPIVSSIEYWLGSADRLTMAIRKQIELCKDGGDIEKAEEQIEAFYDRNHPMVDERIDELTVMYAPHVRKIELTDPVPFPIGSHTETIHYPPTMYEAISSGTEQLSISQISGNDYLLTDERISDTINLISGDDYLLSLGNGWSEEDLDHPYEDITIIDYDYDYTLAVTLANRI